MTGLFTGFLTLGGVEIVNDARAYTYATSRGVPLQCEPCPTLRRALEDDRYIDPEADEAPWFDPAEPASAGFYGVTGMGVKGLSKSTVNREPVELVSGGAMIGPATHGAREMVWDVMLTAADDCSLSYGLAWITAALAGKSCGGCNGDDACVFTCCPRGTGQGAAGDRELRNLFHTGLVEGPEVTERFRMSGSVGVRVEFTLAAGVPWLYRLPVNVTEGARPTGQLYVSPRPTPPTECSPEMECIDDPECRPPPLPPAPPVPVDPCFGDEWYMAKRAIITAQQGLLPQWFDAVPMVRISSGARAMRRVQVRFFANPKGLNCAENLDRCGLCDVISVAYIPPGAVLDIDGRTKRAWIDCTGGSGLAGGAPSLFGPAGGAFTWPVIDCSNSMCIEVLAETANNRVEDWTVSIDFASREDIT